MTDFESALESSLRYLESPAAVTSLERDPYWPKWDSPWWHLQLLLELGLEKKAPRNIVRKLVEVLNSHYLRFFPLKTSELPEGTDPTRQVLCHCAVAGAYRFLRAYGVDTAKDVPWMRSWFLKYELPDGGVNCDERAYLKEKPKSSIMSSVPCFEALLESHARELTPEERDFLERGARYLVRQGLFRRLSTGEVIDPDWLEIRFPRFYDYDFLRGYLFLAKWRDLTGFVIPQGLTDEVKELMRKHLSPDGVRLLRRTPVDPRSYNPQPDGSWAMGESRAFDLFEAVNFNGALSEVLTRQSREAGLI